MVSVGDEQNKCKFERGLVVLPEQKVRVSEPGLFAPVPGIL
jgi:hypothetical protein